jgi:chitodextrinase
VGDACPAIREQTLVIYELLNEPCGDPPGPVGQDAAIYKIIRAVAPSTPIMHISTMQIASIWAIACKNLAATCGFNWADGKDIFAFHTYAGTQAKYIKELQALGIPSICSEWGYAGDPWGPATLDGYARESEWLERNCMSWIDWHDWWIANPLDHGLNLLLPDAQAKQYAWWINAAPFAPTVLSAKAQDSYTAILTWSKPASVGSGIYRYAVYRNDREIAMTTGESYVDTGLQALTAYSYEVTALGVGALESSRSNRVDLSTPIDNVPPALVSGAGDGSMVHVVFAEKVEQTGAYPRRHRGRGVCLRRHYPNQQGALQPVSDYLSDIAQGSRYAGPPRQRIPGAVGGLARRKVLHFICLA